MLLFKKKFFKKREENKNEKSTHTSLAFQRQFISRNIYKGVIIKKKYNNMKKEREKKMCTHTHTRAISSIETYTTNVVVLSCCIEGICCDHPEWRCVSTAKRKSEISDNCSSLRPNQLFIYRKKKQQTDMLGTKYNGHKENP